MAGTYLKYQTSWSSLVNVTQSFTLGHEPTMQVFAARLNLDLYE